ncbi:ABC transporter ATP-binding protein [Glaciibacter superstes]|uniref:ABC transporter ATP-binding protein n=1 Tax=Glaciibacter superstes TaxID=501023 RepID=UPI0003B52663|nr:ATP-binding cassette domain-containing protein [Glaciibacter superstes]
MHAIEIDHLVKSYDHLNAVDDLTFAVRAGSVTGFLGPNGAGKTSTIQVLLGLAKATSGTATVFGQNYGDLEDPTGTVGALLEPSGIHPARSGRDHLRVLAASAKIPDSRVDAVVKAVGMEQAARRKARTYSMGMRQRIGIAAALLGSPRILILDEPANGLDPAGMLWLRKLLREFADDGGTVLLSSHVLAEVTQVADDILIIAQGKLVLTQELDALVDSASLEDTYLNVTAGAEAMR